MTTTDIFLMTIEGSFNIGCYVSISILVCVGLGMYIDYRRIKKIYEEIYDRLSHLDKKYLVPELVEIEGTQEGGIIMDILRLEEMSMGDNVAMYRRNIDYYKEYIETWVHEVKIPISTAKMIMENHSDALLGQSEIDVEIDRIETYVEQALYYAKSADVEKDYFIKDVDIEEIVKAAVSKRKKNFIAMRAMVDIANMQSERSIKSDGKWLSFIIGQILDNSIKYAKSDENLKIKIWTEDKDKNTILFINDNGVGMKSSEVGRVFDKGFTGSNGRSGKASTGIGLYLCRRLCERLGISIELESKEGEGTTVKIVF